MLPVLASSGHGRGLPGRRGSPGIEQLVAARLRADGISENGELFDPAILVDEPALPARPRRRLVVADPGVAGPACN